MRLRPSRAFDLDVPKSRALCADKNVVAGIVVRHPSHDAGVSVLEVGDREFHCDRVNKFHAKHNSWPAVATIQYVGGEARSFAVDPAEAENVVREMLEALERLNRFEGNPENLAKPSKDACQWCQFKAACSPFYASLDEGWHLPDRHVLGRVLAIEETGPRTTLELEVKHGNVAQESLVVVAPDGLVFEGVSAGDMVGIASASPTRSPKTIRCTWESVICVWKDAQQPYCPADPG
jgi:hypothetical protein